MSARLSSPKSILVVVQRPDWTDTACHWGQHWMEEYVTRPATEATFEVVDLYADDAIRSRVLEACKSPNFTYFSGLGHGSATTFTGQRKGRIFWKGDEETKAVSNGKHFNFLSCVFGREGAKWMQEEGKAIGVHGYDESFIFVIDRGDFPNRYAHPFFDSHATVDRELFKGASHGEAHQACLDRFEYWIENAPEVCQRYLAWDKEHKVFWGDPQAKILPRLTVTSDGCCPITVDGLGTVAPGATEEFTVAWGTEVTLTADENDPCCEFDGWKVDGSPVGGNPINVTMDSNHTTVATCPEPGPYTLTVASHGCCPITIDGLGTVAPGATEEFTVACGTEVTLTADESDPSCEFDGWEVDGSPLGGNPINVTMDSNHTAVATCSEPGRASSFWEIIMMRLISFREFIMRWIRTLLRSFGFTEAEKERTYSLALKEAGKLSGDIEERLSRVEAALQEIKGSIDLTNKRIDDLREDLSDIRSDIRDLRGRLWWIIGILLSMWMTIILTILFRR